MVARNDITGDAIQTKSSSAAYRDHYENIFRKTPKESDDDRAEDEAFETLEKQNQVKDSTQGG